MTKRHLFRSIIALAVALPMSIGAQTDVNREKYPDYSDKINPDWSLVKQNGAQKSASRAAESQRPAYVNNAELKFFPPVFNQDGGSCGSASRICYMFTYEMNAYRDLDGKDANNYYPSHFVWLLTNGNSGKNEFVTSIGVPSAATYGGQTYSSLFGSQDCSNNDFGWMQGYDKWFEAMHNRMLEPMNFPLNVGTEEGRELVKNWLWNHNGDTSFKGGGICGIGVASAGGDYDAKIPNSEANRNAGVVGKKYVKAWGPGVDHALTIVGYDDRIEFDIDGNGVVGETAKDEVGAWIIVNSWGTWWGNNGFIYCPYAFGGPAFTNEGTFPGNWWQPEIYKVRKDYRPLRTIKLEMEYSRRSEMKLLAGISSDINATTPEKTIEFEHFRYAGDGNYGNTNPAPEIPMLGRWADGKLHREPMEFGYDLTDLTNGYDRSMPLKYFFIVETRSWAKGSGKIHNASIIDYEFDRSGLETPFDIADGVEIRNAGNKTIISVVVYGEEYYSPNNFSLLDRTLSWTSPIRSSKEVKGYRIYNNDGLIAEVDANTFKYNLPQGTALEGTFFLAALYSDGTESQKVAIPAPAVKEEENYVINLKKSGFTISDIFDSKYENATIEFYIKPNSLSNWNQTAGPGWGKFMMHANADGTFTAGWDVGQHRLNSPAGTLKVGTWTHIALVVKGKSMALYVNGERKTTVSSSMYSGIGGFGDLRFESGGNDACDASFDEIRIWNKVRSTVEIKNSMKADFTGSVMPDGLIAYYKGNVIDINGTKALREYTTSNHAEIFGSSFVQETRTPALGETTANLSASINPAGSNITVGAPVTFTATYSDAVTKMTWSIQDAGIDNLPTTSPTAIFTSPGEKSVTMTAEDNKGNTVSDTITVTVNEEANPDATFKASKERVVLGEKISFIVLNPQLGFSYEWDIPGTAEGKAYGLHASASYEETGLKRVTLKATSLNSGKSATSSIEMNVIESAPSAAFEVSPAIILKGEKTYLKDQSKFYPSNWQWSIESNEKRYVIYGQNSSFTPTESGVYNVTLEAGNEVGSNSHTQERALIVCNADSKNGLNFSGRDNAKVTAKTNGFSGLNNTITVEWWMRPETLKDDCLGIGESHSTFLLTTKADGTMWLSANGSSGKSNSGFVIPNEWHHYAVILDGNYADFYRDGKRFGTSYISSSAYIPSLESFSIGHDDAKMNGQIDELRVWTGSVKGSALLAVCNAPIEAPAEHSNLVLYYDFNQSGGNVIDRTANGNDGVRSGFGPDGDAWGLSRGVFCLNTNQNNKGGNVSSKYLTNYYNQFKYDSSKSVNGSVSNRFYALTGWTLENATINGNITTGAHVDKQKDYYLTVTTGWDGFSTTVSNHKVYQTVTLPAGNYKFTAKYGNWEGQCDNSYIAVGSGKNMPGTASIENAIAYSRMVDKSIAMQNSVEFSLDEESQVSLGLIINMNGKICMTIKEFTLESDNTEYLEANGETTAIECIMENFESEADNVIYDLQGRKVLKPTKGGIYIKNGKKYLVK